MTTTALRITMAACGYTACILLAILLMGVGAAAAGTYSVYQCDYQLGITTSSFSWQSAGVPSPVAHGGSGCGEFGLAVRTSGLGSMQTYPGSAYSGYLSTAPIGTAFKKFRGAFGTLVSCCVSGMDAYAEARESSDGSGARDEIFRGSLGSLTWQSPDGSQGPVWVEWDADDAGFAAEQIGFLVGCSLPVGCAQSATGDVRVRARTFEFQLEDLVAPDIAGVDGSLVSGGWVGGTRSLEIGASDQGGGLSRVSARLGGELIVNAPLTCSEVSGRYLDLRPCPLVSSGAWTIDTRGFDDGPVALDVRADDVGGASTNDTTTILVDNSPPGAPSGISLEGEQGWRSSNRFVTRWTPDLGGDAPVVSTRIEVCRQPGGSCEHRTLEGDPGTVELEVPSLGDYKATLRFEDAAGNVGPSSDPNNLVLRFDDESPGRARLDGPTRWLSGDQAKALDIAIALEDGAVEPLSGIAGYSVTTDGTSPDAAIDIGGHPSVLELDDLPEGETAVKASAVSGAGVLANDAGAAWIKIDRTSPTVLAQGLRSDLVWSRESFVVLLMGVDQPHLSDMTPAGPDQPVESGGHVAYELDGGPVERVRGGLATVTVATDGEHRLVYRAFDAAGNGSVEREARFRIDRTAPEGEFRRLDPADPRALKVDVEDATSGVAGGWIEYRRVGAGAFRRLETEQGGGVLSARLDDASLADGRYELRAVVRDVAGNEAVIERWADGSVAALALPLRLGSTLNVTGHRATCDKARRERSRGGKRGPGGKRTRKCAPKPARTKTLALAYGRRALSAGRLTTGQGAPIARARIVVEGRPRSGGAFAKLGTTRTDAGGRFAFKVPAGPSRTVRYRYDGTNVIRPATGQLKTKVRAAARLKVDRRRLRNGQAVRFAGRLLGRPIPPAGKLVALQAKVGRGWRTFATPRADAKGRFRHRYRFTATTGTRRYAFRVVVAREAAYPYEAGVSRTVAVTVRGR